MRTLRFNISAQTIKKDTKCDFSGLVPGSVGYLRAGFKFSPEWYGCTKAASFWIDDKEYAVLLDSLDACVIPEEVLTGEMFEVSVTGVKQNFKITTNKTKVRQGVY